MMKRSIHLAAVAAVVTRHGQHVDAFSSARPALSPLITSRSSTTRVAASISPDDESYQRRWLQLIVDPLQTTIDNTATMKGDELINIGVLAAISTAVFANILLVGPMADYDMYEDMLQLHPIYTKAATSATVYAIGDLISQATEGTSMGEIDRARTLRSLLAGLIGHGPMSHVWYNVSENFFNNIAHLTAWWSVIPKVAVDQSVFGPIWNNSYLLLLGLMKQDSLSTIFKDMKRTTIPLIISGLKLWPFVHLITYGLIPIENRVLWVDAVEIVWVTILATQAAGGADANNSSEDGEESAKSDVAMADVKIPAIEASMYVYPPYTRI